MGTGIRSFCPSKDNAQFPQLLPPSPKTTPAFYSPFIYRNLTLKPHTDACLNL